MEKERLSSLSREELEDIIQRQQTKIEKLTTVPPNDWHSLFYALLMIVTHRFKSVKVDREVVLGGDPFDISMGSARRGPLLETVELELLK